MQYMLALQYTNNKVGEIKLDVHGNDNFVQLQSWSTFSMVKLASESILLKFSI